MEITEYYDIRQIIGHGSSCTVRKAIKKQTEEVYAVKVYENQRLKAKNQIDMLIRLQHPNIVNIYDAYDDEETITLVLQYMVGGQLYDMVGTKTTFGQSQVRQYMKAMVDAIRYCHELQVVHRDIKPENLLLTTKGPDAILKLADFGISKILSEEMLNTNCGTPIYMAPEIWMGLPYDEKVDIWSLGVVMYYLLSGHHPFEGDNESLIENIRDGELKFPGQHWNTISYKAVDLIKLLLQKDPKKRPSANEVANHLWICHIEEIPRITFEMQEVNLYKTVRKIRRNIYKQRLKKNTKMLKDILHTQKISKLRRKFVLHEADMSMTAEENSMDIES